MILNQLRVPAADFSGETACLKFNEIVETLRQYRGTNRNAIDIVVLHIIEILLQRGFGI